MPPRAPRATLSLKARALRWLAQREHSRQELRLKLVRAARLDADARTDVSAGTDVDAPAEVEAVGVTVDALLDALESAGHLSEQRFVESRIRTRSARFGNRRIEAEIRQHGLEAASAAIESLGGSELQRAHRVWVRRYGPEVSTDRLEQARQTRFLAARGFSAGTVAAVVRGKAPDRDEEQT